MLQHVPHCISQYNNIGMIHIDQGIGNSRLINFNSNSRMDKGSKKCPSYKVIFFSTALASFPLTLSIGNIFIGWWLLANIHWKSENAYPSVITEEKMVDNFRAWNNRMPGYPITPTLQLFLSLSHKLLPITTWKNAHSNSSIQITQRAVRAMRKLLGM